MSIMYWHEISQDYSTFLSDRPFNLKPLSNYACKKFSNQCVKKKKKSN